MMELLLVVVLVGVMAAVGFAPAYTVLAIKDIKEAKAEAIANINRDFWVAEYYRHVAIDSTNTKLELDAREEKELVKVLFEDAVTEGRLLTAVEMNMVKEIITNFISSAVINALKFLTYFSNLGSIVILPTLETEEVHRDVFILLIIFKAFSLINIGTALEIIFFSKYII